MDYITFTVFQTFNQSKKSKPCWKNKAVMNVLQVPYHKYTEFITIFEDSTILHFTTENNEIDKEFLEKIKNFELKTNFKKFNKNKIIENEFMSFNFKYSNENPEFKFYTAKLLYNDTVCKGMKINPLKYMKLECQCISDSGK